MNRGLFRCVLAALARELFFLLSFRFSSLLLGVSWLRLVSSFHLLSFVSRFSLFYLGHSVFSSFRFFWAAAPKWTIFCGMERKSVRLSLRLSVQCPSICQFFRPPFLFSQPLQGSG